MLASQRSAEEYATVAPYVDGDAYYWSSLDPEVDLRAQERLDDLAAEVHRSRGLWIPSVAPGFDAARAGVSLLDDTKVALVAAGSTGHLEDAERAHLHDLARAVNPVAPKPRRSTQRVRPVVQRIVDAMTTPAIVRNSRVDYLSANALGRALYAPVFDSREQPANSARFTFLDPGAHDFYAEWERTAKDLVAHLRSEAGRNPYDKNLSDLVGELSTRSPEFRTWWASHNVRLHRTSTKQMHHPVVGDLELTGEALALPGDTGLTIITYTVEPHSASEQALNFLSSWVAQTVSNPGDAAAAKSGPPTGH